MRCRTREEQGSSSMHCLPEMSFRNFRWVKDWEAMRWHCLPGQSSSNPFGLR